MRVRPLEIGPIHFTGIGGIGMSGIAEVLANMGYRIQGSDLGENANIARLRRLGIDVTIGQHAQNLGDAEVVVISSAVPGTNPELAEARRRRLPVVRRADMLAELMRMHPAVAVAGTHGKTTTTAIIAGLFDTAGLDPTVINGGIINAYGTNARLGKGDWMLVEADESDGSFLRLPATIGIVTNIDPEHMEHYGSFDAVREAYQSFVERLPFYGLAVLCIDHAEVQSLLAKVTDRRVVTYGFKPQADICAVDAELSAIGSRFDVIIRDRRTGDERRLVDLRLSLPGNHNISNALAAIATGLELGMSDEVLRNALCGLKGVKRRFTITGVPNGVTVVDDYAHHPVEIEAVLHTARAATDGRLIALMQPHRYSRLKDLFDSFCTCFGNADTVLIAPVFPAGEAPIAGADHKALAQGLVRFGQRDVRTIEDLDDSAAVIAGISQPGDMVVCLGAGNITQWAAALPERLGEAKAA